MAEFGMVHRYELSGVLHGLFRVRTFTQDDAHVFCTPEQIEQEVICILNMAQAIYKKFNFTHVRMALATRPEKAIGDDAQWDVAIQALANAMDKVGITYEVEEGEVHSTDQKLIYTLKMPWIVNGNVEQFRLTFFTAKL